MAVVKFSGETSKTLDAEALERKDVLLGNTWLPTWLPGDDRCTKA